MKTLPTTIAAMLVMAWSTQIFAGAEKAKEDSTTAPYPLKTCVVSGESLDAMGGAYIYQHKGQEVRFCCKGCIKDFQKDPEKYLKRIEEARKAQAAGMKEEEASGHEGHTGSAPSQEGGGHGKAEASQHAGHER